MSLNTATTYQATPSEKMRSWWKGVVIPAFHTQPSRLSLSLFAFGVCIELLSSRAAYWALGPNRLLKLASR